MSKLISLAIGMTLIGLILAFVPITIEIPSEIYNFLTNGFFYQMLKMSCYFFPVQFAFNCFLIIFFARHIDILLGVLNWIFNIVKN